MLLSNFYIDIFKMNAINCSSLSEVYKENRGEVYKKIEARYSDEVYK